MDTVGGCGASPSLQACAAACRTGLTPVQKVLALAAFFRIPATEDQVKAAIEAYRRDSGMIERSGLPLSTSPNAWPPNKPEQIVRKGNH